MVPDKNLIIQKHCTDQNIKMSVYAVVTEDYFGGACYPKDDKCLHPSCTNRYLRMKVFSTKEAADKYEADHLNEMKDCEHHCIKSVATCVVELKIE